MEEIKWITTIKRMNIYKRDTQCIHSTVVNDRISLSSKLQRTRTTQDALKKNWFEENILECQTDKKEYALDNRGYNKKNN